MRTPERRQSAGILVAKLAGQTRAGHNACDGTSPMQMALLAATRDREAAQAALTEAKTRQDETAEVSATLPVLSPGTLPRLRPLQHNITAL